MKKIRKVLLVVLALTFILNACNTKETKKVEESKEIKTEETASAELKDITFVLDWTPNTNHTGVYVAKEKGYFKDEGLNVEIVQPSEGGAESLVGSGWAQFGVSFQDYMPPMLSGNSKLPIVAISAIMQHNHSGILSRKGDGITNPKGLEGKKYATWDLPIEKGIIKTVMEKDGGDFSKVELIPSTVVDEITALKSEQIDAVWVYYGWAGIAAKVKNYDTDYMSFKDFDETFDFYSPVIITNENLIKTDPELVKKFISAVKKGYEFAIENPKESADILLAADNTLDKDLVYASQEWVSKEYRSDSETWGYIDPERWSRFFKWVNDNDIMLDKVDPNAGFTNDFIK